MTDKLTVIQMILQTNNEKILGEVHLLLSAEIWKSDPVESPVPASHYKKLRSARNAYKNWEISGTPWNTVKASLQNELKKWVIA